MYPRFSLLGEDVRFIVVVFPAPARPVVLFTKAFSGSDTLLNGRRDNPIELT